MNPIRNWNLLVEYEETILYVDILVELHEPYKELKHVALWTKKALWIAFTLHEPYKELKWFSTCSNGKSSLTEEFYYMNPIRNWNISSNSSGFMSSSQPLHEPYKELKRIDKFLIKCIVVWLHEPYKELKH